MFLLTFSSYIQSLLRNIMISLELRHCKKHNDVKMCGICGLILVNFDILSILCITAAYCQFTHH